MKPHEMRFWQLPKSPAKMPKSHFFLSAKTNGKTPEVMMVAILSIRLPPSSSGLFSRGAKIPLMALQRIAGGCCHHHGCQYLGPRLPTFGLPPLWLSTFRRLESV